MDGDGDRDFAVLGSKISIWLNDGTGQFQRSDADFSGAPVGDLVIGDIDGDDDQDIVTALSGETQLMTLVNDGTGQFTRSQSTEADTIPGHLRLKNLNIELADFDSDGNLDLAMGKVLSDLFIGGDESSNAIWLNNGNGLFQESQPDLAPSTDGHILIARKIIGKKMGIGDLDHDGDIDLMIPGSPVLTNNGAGHFQYARRGVQGHFIHTGSSTVIHIEDLNGDGKDDILKDASRLTFEIDESSRFQIPSTLHTASSANTFDWAQSFTREKLLAVSIGDLNQDSNLDIALATDEGVEIWLRGMDRRFPPQAFELEDSGGQKERNAIAAALNKSASELTRLDLATILELDLSRRALTSLDLPNGLINLTHLDVSNNSITELKLPEDVKKLDSFNFSNPSAAFQAGVHSVRLGSGFETITSLGLLGLGINELIFDAEMPALTTISLWSNRITDFTFLEKTPNLETLNLGSNRLTELTLPLGPRRLRELTLSRNSIPELRIPTGMRIDRLIGLNRDKITFYTPAPRVGKPTLQGSDSFQFQIAATESEIVIEVSQDLKTWREFDRLTIEAWHTDNITPIMDTPGPWFFRAVPVLEQ